MEVCGTHTASIVKNGIPSLLSDKIRLISGPGCPVCVTVTAYIDRLISLAMEPGNLVLCFGDLLRVRRLQATDSRDGCRWSGDPAGAGARASCMRHACRGGAF